MKDLDEVRKKLREFADERDWDQFHSPKAPLGLGHLFGQILN
jgi:hypothetical protein